MSARNPIHTLVVESDPVAAESIREILTGSDFHPFGVTIADQLSTGLEHLARGAVDVILLSLPPSDGRSDEALAQLHTAAPDVPIVVLTDCHHSELGLAAQSRGAALYLIKENVQNNEGLLALALVLAVERGQTEAVQRGQIRNLKLLIEHSVDGICLTDETGILTKWNPAMERITGLPRAEALGRLIWDVQWQFAPEEDREPALYDELAVSVSGLLRTEGALWSDSWPGREIQRMDGERRFVQSTLFSIKTDQGFMIGATLRDITEARRNEEKLHRSEELYRRIVETTTEGIWIVDAEGKTTFVNARMAEMLGYTAEEMLGAPQSAFMDEEGQAIAAQGERRRLGIAEQHEFKFRRKDNTDLWVYCSTAPFFDEAESYIGALAMVTDITERKQAGEAERDQRILAEAVRDSMNAIASTLDTDIVMTRILENVGRVVPHDSANIMLVEEDSVRFAFFQGYSEEVEAFLKGYHLSIETPGLCQMLVSGAPLVIDDTAAYPGWVDVLGDGRVRSYVSAPIRVHGQVIGFLNLDSAVPGFFTPIHAERLQTFADQAALAIGNAQIYDALNNYAQEMTTLYRATSFLFANLTTSQDVRSIAVQIVEAVAKAFGEVNCGVMLVDVERGELVRLARTGNRQVPSRLYLDGPGLVPLAVRQGTIIYAPDVSQAEHYVPNVAETQSELVIPLHSANGVLGVLDLQSTRRDAFGECDRRALESFANWAAMAIENVRLYEAIRAHAAELGRRVEERTQELNQAKERVEIILNSSSDAIVLLDMAGNIRQTNPAFNQMFDYDVDELFGRPLMALAVPDQTGRVADVLFSTPSNNDPKRLEFVASRKDGTAFDADMALSPLLQSIDQRSGFVCSLRDITAQKQMEADLRQTLEQEKELGELKSRFISMASHEFRTPLATIASSNYLLEHRRDRMTDEKVRKHFTQIQQAVDYMAQLLDEVLLIGRAEAGRLEFNPAPLDLVWLCQDVVEAARQNAGPDLEIVSSIAVGCINLIMDEKLVRHILTNLLSNAVKYSLQGGTVRLDVNCGSDAVVIQVQDEGIGIPEKDQARLFEPFHRAENVGTIKGTGLGLSIVKRAVERHGGTIRFESRVDVGTTFIVSIPSVLPEEEGQ